ncbi:MAG TPA: DinB family protein [Frankiaceae bacterium]|nr:DinB family protein [Frankiaceae bacterium]
MPGQVRPVTDERDSLLAFLAQQRLVLRIAAYGLTEEQVRFTPTASALSVGGLIKHCIAAERSWLEMVLHPTGSAPDPSAIHNRAEEYLDNFRLRPDETLEDLLADFDAVAMETEEMARSSDLDRPVPVPKGVPWFPDDLDAWSVRWVLMHLIAEHARHAGHADIIRESIDGATAFPLMAAVENWPATPWIQPWSPSEATATPG